MMSSSTAETTACVNCSKGETEDCKLKSCTACKMVKYCSRDCQISHRPQHKKACKKRAAELFDEELFKDPPEREECPICMLPLPFDERNIMFQSCCGKFICSGCNHDQIKNDCSRGKAYNESGDCAFCRTPPTSTDKGIIDRLIRGVDRNDPNSIVQLASFYADGRMGLQKDLAKAIEMFQKSGELGCATAYYWLGALYHKGMGYNVK